jgi:Flp pilus assembly protein CpaB
VRTLALRREEEEREHTKNSRPTGPAKGSPEKAGETCLTERRSQIVTVSDRDYNEN